MVQENETRNKEKRENMQKVKSGSTSINPHIGWTIAVMVIIIISLLTILLTKPVSCPNLQEGIVNFSTILSIILSISSILFAYFTSRDTSNQYIEMGKALEEVRITNKHMSENNSQLMKFVYNIALHVKSLDDKYQIQMLLAEKQRNSTPNNKQQDNVINSVSNDTAITENQETSLEDSTQKVKNSEFTNLS